MKDFLSPCYDILAHLFICSCYFLLFYRCFCWGIFTHSYMMFCNFFVNLFVSSSSLWCLEVRLGTLSIYVYIFNQSVSGFNIELLMCCRSVLLKSRLFITDDHFLFLKFRLGFFIFILLFDVIILIFVVVDFRTI